MLLYSVEKTGFKRIVHTFELPSHKYFSQTAIPKMYKETRGLQEVEHFSATTNLWSSGTMEPYLGITVHYILNDWYMHSQCLQMLFCSKDYKAENLSEAMKEILDTWNLQ